MVVTIHFAVDACGVLGPLPLFSSCLCCCLAGVDTSRPALDLARQNAALNGISEDVCSFQQADVSDFMKQAVADGRQWDLVRFAAVAISQTGCSTWLVRDNEQVSAGVFPACNLKSCHTR